MKYEFPLLTWEQPALEGRQPDHPEHRLTDEQRETLAEARESPLRAKLLTGAPSPTAAPPKVRREYSEEEIEKMHADIANGTAPSMYDPRFIR